MSECVVRMEMPKACWSCGLRFVCKAAYDFMTTRAPAAGCSVLKVGMEGCLIVCQLPEGHGRLVDEDALVNQWATVPDKLAAGAGENKWVADMVMGIQGHFLEGIIKSLEEAPTIVPAERSET